MMFHDDDKDKEQGEVSDEALGEVLDNGSEDEDEGPATPLEDDEKEWE